MALGIVWASALTSLLVGAIAAGMALVALRARRRTGNRQLLFVGAAFLLFGVKSLFSAYNVLTDVVHHDTLELVLSVFDLAIMVLLVLPLTLKGAA